MGKEERGTLLHLICGPWRYKINIIYLTANHDSQFCLICYCIELNCQLFFVAILLIWFVVVVILIFAYYCYCNNYYYSYITTSILFIVIINIYITIIVCPMYKPTDHTVWSSKPRGKNGQLVNPIIHHSLGGGFNNQNNL